MELPPHRFEVLDSWRGLSAVLVALFHLQAYSHVYSLSVLRHSYLFVDFFFVLSGFVITANYRTKLLTGTSFWQFMFLRLGRVYPLHVAILIGLVALETARYWFSGMIGGQLNDKFSGSTSVPAIFTNLLLIQSLHIHDGLTWNLPSWSISVEFYAYAIFAVIMLFLARWAYAVVSLVLLLAPLFLLIQVGHIDTQFDFGLIRAMFGFFVGFVCYDLYRKIQQLSSFQRTRTVMSLAEIACVCLVLAFVSIAGDGGSSVAAPLVFGCAVLIFSFQQGLVSDVLRLRPFALLGVLSYSIYMIHAPVLIAVRYFLQFIGAKGGPVLLNEGRFGADMWQGDLLYLVYISVVIFCSFFTYRFIEEPARLRSRALAKRLFRQANDSRELMVAPLR